MAATDDDRPREESSPPPIVVGVDYYVENGRYVFTASYLLKRGYCCRNRCRHCPYGYLAPPTPRDDRE